MILWNILPYLKREQKNSNQLEIFMDSKSSISKLLFRQFVIFARLCSWNKMIAPGFLNWTSGGTFWKSELIILTVLFFTVFSLTSRRFQCGGCQMLLIEYAIWEPKHFKNTYCLFFFPNPFPIFSFFYSLQNSFFPPKQTLSKYIYKHGFFFSCEMEFFFFSLRQCI